MKFLKDLM